MKYIVLTGFCLGKGIDVNPGDRVELSAVDASLKLAANQIKKIIEVEPETNPGLAQPVGGDIIDDEAWPVEDGVIPKTRKGASNA